MQSVRVVCVLFIVLLIAGAIADRSKANPLGKVIELLNGLAAKVKAEGETKAKAYKEYFDWCEDFARNKQFEIKTVNAQIEKLQAAIEKAGGDIETSDTKI